MHPLPLLLLTDGLREQSLMPNRLPPDQQNEKIIKSFFSFDGEFPSFTSCFYPPLILGCRGQIRGRVHPGVTSSPGWKQKFARAVEVVMLEVVLVVRGTARGRRGPEMES